MYIPDSKALTSAPNKLRLNYWKKLAVDSKVHEGKAIRYRGDLSNSRHQFLCETWPDVKDSEKTSREFGIIGDNIVLFRIQGVGGFRTLKHFIAFSFFNVIEKSHGEIDYAKFFISSHRHEAAKIYMNFMSVKKNRKISKERKKSNASEHKISKITSEWNRLQYQGLKGPHAVTVSNWPCASILVGSHLSKTQFNKFQEEFNSTHIFQVLAKGIHEIFSQNPMMKVALVSTRLPLIAIGSAQKDVWHHNSGHNLHAEMLMHYRSLCRSGQERTYQNFYAVGSPYFNHGSSDPVLDKILGIFEPAHPTVTPTPTPTVVNVVNVDRDIFHLLKCLNFERMDHIDNSWSRIYEITMRLRNAYGVDEDNIRSSERTIKKIFTSRISIYCELLEKLNRSILENASKKIILNILQSIAIVSKGMTKKIIRNESDEH